MKTKLRLSVVMCVAGLLLAAAFPRPIFGANFTDDFSNGLSTNFWSTNQSKPGLYSVITNQGNLQINRTTQTNSGGTQFCEVALNSAVFNNIMFGDFSTSLTFTNAVLPGPGIDQIGIQVNLRDGTYFNCVVDNENGGSAFVSDGSVHGLTATNDSAGTLTIARVGYTLGGYYNGSLIFSKSNSAPLVNILFFVQSSSTDDLTSTTFDGFTMSYPILHPFAGAPFEGSQPMGSLALSGPTLFGTTYAGGNSGSGTLFRVNTNGMAYTNLYNFTGNNDGANPVAGLCFLNGALYGTTEAGGTGGIGAIFRINTDGTGFSNLFSFPADQSNGYQPESGLVVAGNSLYGTTFAGGDSGYGTIFGIYGDGTGFTNVHSFSTLNYDDHSFLTNGDGAYPTAGLVSAGNVLYGTASKGGFGYGTVFRINTDGSGFTNLYSFSTGALKPGSVRTNADGLNPMAGLALSGNTLYGAARAGGVSGYGTLFSVNTDGTGFTTLHSFTAAPSGPPFNGTNSDGATPLSALTVSGKTLYGTTSRGGVSGLGTVFQMNTDGTGFVVLKNFAGAADGAQPNAALVLSNNTLYGTTPYGGISQLTLFGQGTANSGTVFAVTLPTISPTQLAIALAGSNVVLTWPAAASGFTLQSTTNLLSPIAWNSVSPTPIIVNGQNTVTNAITNRQMFYRLAQ